MAPRLSKRAAAVGIVVLLVAGCSSGAKPSAAPLATTTTPDSTTTSVAAETSTSTTAAATTATTGPAIAAPSRRSPVVGAAWQLQLAGGVDESVDVPTFDVDLFETDAAVVQRLRAKGRTVVCYLSAGSYEPYRPDSAKYPEAVKGKALDGWPDERWLDVRRLDVLGPILEARMDLCRSKGFHAVDPDNMDGYSNDSGFPLTADDQLRFDRFVAKAAHDRSLSVGLKNALDLIPSLVGDFDWALNEQCVQYDECSTYRPFVAARKAVLNVEYDVPLSRACPATKAIGGIATMRKHLNLDAYREACPA